MVESLPTPKALAVGGHRRRHCKTLDSLQVLLYSTPEYGHAFPLVKIAKVLHDRGHQVHFAVSAFFAPRLAQFSSFMQIVPLNDGLTLERQHEVQHQCSSGPYPMWQLHGDIGRASLKQAIADMDAPPDVFISDFTSFAGFEVTDELGNQWPVLASVPLPLARAKNARPTFFHMMSHSWWDIPKKLKFRCRASLGDPMAVAYRRVARCLLGNMLLVHSDFCIDIPEMLPPLVTLVGVLPVPEDQAGEGKNTKGIADVATWIAASPGTPIVYVSTGSWVKLTQAQVTALGAGLANDRWRVLWSLRDEYRPMLPPSVLEDQRFLIRPWLPQAEILREPAVKMMLTHCGWGGLTEVLVEGKPVVAMPFVGDQPTNACLVEERGLGVKLDTPRITAQSVAAAVTLVLSNESFSKRAVATGRILRLRAQSTILAETVETLAQCGDAHLQMKIDLDDSKMVYWPRVLTIALATSALLAVCSMRRGRS